MSPETLSLLCQFTIAATIANVLGALIVEVIRDRASRRRVADALALEASKPRRVHRRKVPAPTLTDAPADSAQAQQQVLTLAAESKGGAT